METGALGVNFISVVSLWIEYLKNTLNLCEVTYNFLLEERLHDLLSERDGTVGDVKENLLENRKFSFLYK